MNEIMERGYRERGKMSFRIADLTRPKHPKTRTAEIDCFDGVNAAGGGVESFIAGPDHIRLSTSIFLISAMALAGFRPFGQVWAQFMIVWQR
jgi:hypothetical protein